MQETTLTWKGLWSSGAAWLEARADIGGASYSDIAPVITRATMQGGPQIGNAVAASCAFSLRGVPGANVPRSAEVLISMRLTDGETTSEWLPAGTFYISRRSVEPVSGMLQLECYDALLKADAVWEPSEGSWPRDMADVADELAAALGLEIDARSAIPTGGVYVMGEPDAGTTLRGALSTIAAAGGGNWIVSPTGRLRLVPFTPGADAVAVEAVLSDARASDAQAVTGVRCLQDGGDPLLVGDDTGIVLDVGLTPVLAAEMSATVIGAAYQGCSLSGAVYDPAAELGDRLTYGAGVSSVLACETVTLGPAPRGEVSAPELSELADEYPFLGGSARALTLAKAYAREAVGALDGDLTQTEIFNRLTGNGAAQGMVLYNGQLYINASYINAGALSANRISGGTLTLGGNNDANGTITIKRSDGTEVGWIDKRGFLSYDPIEDVYASIAEGSMNFSVPAGGGSRTQVGEFWFEYNPDEGIRKTTLQAYDGVNGIPGQLRLVIPTKARIVMDSIDGITAYLSQGLKMAITGPGGDLTVAGGLTLGTALTIANGGTGANNAAGARTNLGVPSTSEMTAAIGQAIEDVIEYVNIGAEDMLAKIAQMSADKMIYFRTTSTTTNGPRSGIYLIGTAVRAGNNITITASEMLHPETIYQNSTNNAGSTWAGWSGIGCAVFNSATPSTVYTTLSSIGIGKSMPFIITNSDAASFLTGGKSTSLLKGIVARTGATGTLYDFISGAGGNQYMYTWRVTATSAADITPGAVYRYTGTAI